MAIAHVQDCIAVGSFAGSPGVATATINGVTSGNTLVAYIEQHGTDVRTYSLEDNVNGAWGSADHYVVFTPGYRCGIWHFPNSASGDITITATQSASYSSGRLGVSEFSGLGTSPTVEAYDSYEEPTASDDHLCSSAGISSSSEVLSACACATGGIVTECNPGSGYAEVTSGYSFTRGLLQWAILTAPSSHQGPWSSTGTDRKGYSVIVFLKSSVSGVINVANPCILMGL